MKVSLHGNLRDIRITLCYRPIRALAGKPHLITCLLREAGYEVTETSNQRCDLANTDILWVWGNTHWYPMVFRQLEMLPRKERPVVLVWHAEPLPPPKSAKLPHPRLHLREIAKIVLSDSLPNDVYSNYFRLRSLQEDGIPDLLLVTTPGRKEFLAEHGISSTYVPLGYHRDEYGYDMGLERDTDVLFLGALDIPRRKRLFRRLRRSGINLQTKGSWYDRAYWGDVRNKFLNRTKIFLNLQRYPGELSGVRLILGMANRTLVISEPMYKPGEFIPGKHYISTTADEMPEVIDYYLSHDDERERIASEGHRFVTRQLTMENSISSILRMIAEYLDNR